jgi:hypothetical protein
MPRVNENLPDQHLASLFQIPSHRVVLAVHSPILRAKLQRQTPEDRRVPRIRIKIPKTSDAASCFKEVLRYMYCGTCRMTSHGLMGLLHICNLYEVCLTWAEAISCKSSHSLVTELSPITVMRLIAHAAHITSHCLWICTSCYSGSSGNFLRGSRDAYPVGRNHIV